MERQVRYAVALVLLTQTVLCFAHAGGREHFEWSAKKGESKKSQSERKGVELDFSPSMVEYMSSKNDTRIGSMIFGPGIVEKDFSLDD